ncbi:MAG: maleylpyruvate isomerase N-terminal domain-containing protein [Dehalococcoidia bacterium]
MTMSEMMRGIIQTVRDNRQRFEAFCRSLSQEELSRPAPDSTWVVKDFVSHLATLDPTLVLSFEATAAGRPEDATRNPDGSPFDLDALNEALVVERREWPLERILEEASANRAALIDSMERLSDEDIAQVMHFTGDAKRSPAQLPLRVFMLGWAHHDTIHAADMLRALPERATDAELAAWVDGPMVKAYQAAMSGPPRR